MGYFKWKPTKANKEMFKEKMCEIEKFCEEKNISHSSSYDSYYFELNGQKYRISNHSPESSPYHWGRDADTIYINASKLRIIQIYIDLMYGNKLDGRGNVLA